MREKTHLNRVFCHFNLMSCIKNFIHDDIILVVSFMCVLFVCVLYNTPIDIRKKLSFEKI